MLRRMFCTPIQCCMSAVLIQLHGYASIIMKSGGSNVEAGLSIARWLQRLFANCRYSVIVDVCRVS